MSKLIWYGLIAGVLVLIGFKFIDSNRGPDSQALPNLPIVAMTQIIGHRTLDTVREGVVAGLEKQGYIDGKTIKLVYDNANGNATVGAQIAKKFIARKPKVIVALSTQSAQLLMKPAQEAKIPLVFSAVTDPVAAKLVSSYEATGEGVTGISDFMPAGPQLDMILAFMPNLTKLGVLYNPSEANSVAFLEKMEQEAQKRGVTFVRGILNSTGEAAEVTKSLAGKVEALFFPNDNTAMAAAPAIANVALQNRLPLFVNDSESVKDGALAAVAYDRIEMGRKTAEIVGGILSGKTPADFPVTHDVASEVVVNQLTLEKLNQTIPDALSTKTRRVGGNS
jgi:putative tryptophan/tyrosine transport system substrate-binding protein